MNIKAVKVVKAVRVPWMNTTEDRFVASDGVKITGTLGSDWVVISKDNFDEALVLKAEHFNVDAASVLVSSLPLLPLPEIERPRKGSLR